MHDVSRRAVLRRGALLAAGAAGAGMAGSAAAADGEQVIELAATASGTGHYLYLPFEVPAGVNRIAVSMAKYGDAAVGIGLFDHRGADYGSPGFRGVYGEELSSFFVSTRAASRAFRPSRIEPGTWTVVVPVFRAPTPTRLSVTVTLSFGRQRGEARLGRAQGVVRAKPGWYRGDLHNHTTHSSDAFSSGSALRPADYPTAMLRAGLDWVVLTDHNVTTSNDHLARDADSSGVLLIGGVEMTNWFHGHATVSGLAPGDWVDWRQRPAGVARQEYERGIDAFFADVRGRDRYTSAAHPAGAHRTPATRRRAVNLLRPHQRNADAWWRVARRAARVRSLSTSCLQSALVAEGTVDAFADAGSDTHRIMDLAAAMVLAPGRAARSWTPSGGPWRSIPTCPSDGPASWPPLVSSPRIWPRRSPKGIE